jgi:predicted permease
MKVIANRILHDHPQDAGNVGIVVIPLREEFISRSRTGLYVLLGAAACVLLLGCANLANLLLARSAERRKELAVRAMLGAGRERLTRQIVTENMLLALVGGALGIAMASAVLPLLSQLVPSQLPIANRLQLDVRLIAVAAGLSMFTGLLFAWGPAWRLSREADLSSIAKDGGRTSSGVANQRTRKLLVAGEVGVSVVLLVSAGLLLRTLLQVNGLDPGFQPEGVFTARTVLPSPKYDDLPKRERFYRDVLRDVRALPGVQAAGFTSFLPFTMTGGIWPVVIDGKPDVKPRPDAVFRTATPGYFEAMRIPLRAGRTFQDSDVTQSITPVIVSESFARQHWKGENAIGRTLSLLEVKARVVGIVGDLPIRGLERSAKPQVYVPHTTRQVGMFHAPKDLAIRVSGDPMALAPVVREIVGRADPDQPVEAVRLMTELIGDQTATRRGQLRLLGVFSGLAFVLAIIGLHGLLSFVVSHRTQEIGVRMALGARSSDVLGMVFLEGMTLAGVGAICGLILAIWVALAMERLLFGVKPFDVVSFTASLGLCMVAAAAACYLPARRAARLDPMRAIRVE